MSNLASNKSLCVMRVFIAILGYIILGVLCYLIHGNEGFTDVNKFTWIAIFVDYTFAISLLLIPVIKASSFESLYPILITFASKVIYYWVVSVITLILLNLDVINMTVAVVAHLVMLLIIAIYTYFGMVASNHAQSVVKKKELDISLIDDLRAMSKIVNLEISSKSYPLQTRNKIAEVEDSLRFLSPVAKPMAEQIEREMLTKLSDIRTAAASGVEADDLNKKLDGLILAIKSRKTILR